MTLVEEIFNELTDENGVHGYSLRWDGRYQSVDGKYTWVESGDRKSFEHDGVNFYFKDDPQYPTFIVEWSVQTREDDFNEYSETIDADVDSVIDMIARVNRCGGRLEYED